MLQSATRIATKYDLSPKCLAIVLGTPLSSPKCLNIVPGAPLASRNRALSNPANIMYAVIWDVLSYDTQTGITMVNVCIYLKMLLIIILI